MSLILGRIGLARAIQPGFDFRGQRQLDRLHPPVAHRLMTRGVGLQLGAVHRHVSELDQTSRPTQAQHLHEQVRQGHEVALAEVGDGAEIRPVQAGHGHDIDPLLTGTSELARRVQPPAVAVEQERHHHARMVGRVAALFRVGVENGREVERLPHRVAHEMRHMPGRHELVQRGRQQPALIDIPEAKHLGHKPNESPQDTPVETLTRTGS